VSWGQPSRPSDYLYPLWDNNHGDNVRMWI
jgi:hypothetical protein